MRDYCTDYEPIVYGYGMYRCFFFSRFKFSAFAANSVLTVSSELPTPTPSPMPSPAPSELIPVNTFVGHDKEGNGSECLYLSAGIQLLVNYTNRDELEVCKRFVGYRRHSN